MIEPSQDRPIYSVQEAAAVLRLSRSALYNHVRSGNLPTRKIGVRVVITRPDLERFRLGREAQMRHRLG